MHHLVTLKDTQSDQIMVINGEALRGSHAKTISAVQDFMNLEQVIKEENFVTVRTRGKRPETCFQEGENSEKDCSILPTSFSNPIYPLELVKKLNSFFTPYNDELYDLTGARGSILPHTIAYV